MKPKLKPWKGWDFRIILCDSKGRYELNDFCDPMIAPHVAEKLMKTLLEKQTK